MDNTLYEIKFFAGPCTQEEADALAHSIIKTAETNQVKIGVVTVNSSVKMRIFR
jgi:hypothetical protein